MASYSFPILPVKDVVSGLIEFGFGPVSQDQLLKSNPDTVSHIYRCFAQYMTQVHCWNDTEQPVFCGLDVLENVELHRESAGNVNFVTKIQKIMQAAGAHDFSSKDIFRPNPQRTIKFLSALINFCRYREDKLLSVSQSMMECEEEAEKELLIAERKTELEGELAKIEAERQSKQPLIQALEAEIKELQQNILALNKQQSDLQAEVRTLKEKINEYNNKISNADFLLLQKTQEGSQLRSQVVQSPDKLKKNLEEKRSHRAELGINVETAMESFQKWNATVEAYSKVHKKVTKSLALVQALQEQLNSCKTVEKDVKALKAKFKDAEKEDWAFEAKRIELQVKVEQLEKSKKNLEAEKEVKCTEAEKELDAMNAQIAPRLQELERAEQRLSEKNSEVEYIQKRRIPEVSASKEAFLDRLVNKQLELAEKVEQYDRLLSNKLFHILGSEDRSLCKSRQDISTC
jgi:kinetochore protein Nuf2